MGRFLSQEQLRKWRIWMTRGPHFRSTQLKTATDLWFRSNLLLPSLSDLVQSVRRQSFSAVMATVVNPSQEMEIYQQLMPPIDNADENIGKWYRRKKMNVGCYAESIRWSSESCIWNDAHMSLRYDTLLSWSEINNTRKNIIQHHFCIGG